MNVTHLGCITICMRIITIFYEKAMHARNVIVYMFIDIIEMLYTMHRMGAFICQNCIARCNHDEDTLCMHICEEQCTYCVLKAILLLQPWFTECRATLG